jgi:hypothetical protein
MIFKSILSKKHINYIISIYYKQNQKVNAPVLLPHLTAFYRLGGRLPLSERQTSGKGPEKERQNWDLTN